MTDNTIILTRKIQIYVESEDKAFVQQAYTTLHQWQHICFRAANYIFTHLFLQEQIKELIYLNEGVQLKLADIKKDPDGILTTSKLNSTQQVLSKNFKGHIPIHILSSLNMTLARHFNNEKISYIKGERSIRNYKKNIPIPFRGTDISKLRTVDDGISFSFSLFRIPFRTYLGKDAMDKRTLLHSAIKEEIKLCTSSLVLEEKKIYLLAVFKIEKDQHSLDSAIIAEASLSLEFPIVVHIGKARYNIGSKEEFLYRRLAIQAARQRVQKGATFNRPQHGKARKLKALKHFKDREYSYIKHKLHVYSRRLIEICIKHRAGNLLLVSQHDKEQVAKEDDFLLRNWSYHELKEKIFYKAAKAGIEVIVE
jgi:hypothetical protein